MIKYIPKTRRFFPKSRLILRVVNIGKISQDRLLDYLRKINVPIIYISGELDVLYPPSRQFAKIVGSVKNKNQLWTSIMAGLPHNTTVAPDEITAANVEHYLELAEKKRSDEGCEE